MRTRAYRRHHRARVKENRLRLLAQYRYGHVPKDIAVRHPFDCGKRCYMCHGEKFCDPRRAREKRQWMSDQL